MDFVSRMTALLSELRRERNGAAADAMTFQGRGCGLNLGVAIPTIRAIAATESADDDFARYLYRQDVRELRIAALCLADAAKVAPADFGFWASGIVNSEIAEQAAMLLFSRSACVDELSAEWGMSGNPLLAYCALMSAARSATCDVGRTLAVVGECLRRFPDNRMTARGAVAVAVALCGRAPAEVGAFVAVIEADTPAAEYFIDEMSWQTNEPVASRR